MPRPVKHHLLYARESWRSSRVWLLGLSAAYCAWGVYVTVQHPSMAHVTQAVVVAVLPLLVIAASYVYARLSYVVFEGDHLTVHGPMRRTTVEYTDIEKARTEVMERLFERPERRRLNRGIVRRLADQRALCLRIREEGGLPDRLRRKLGDRTVLDRDVVLPLADADSALGAVKVGLAARRGAVTSGIAAPRARARRAGRRRR